MNIYNFYKNFFSDLKGCVKNIRLEWCLKILWFLSKKGLKENKRIVFCFKNVYEFKMNKIMFSGLGGGWRGVDFEKIFSKRLIFIWKICLVM